MNDLRKFFHEVIHYLIRSILSVLVWLISFIILIKIPIFFSIENGETELASPIPLLLPLFLAIGTFLLLAKPLNQSAIFYNPMFIERKARAYIDSFTNYYNSALSAYTVTQFLSYWIGAEQNIYQLDLLSKKLFDVQANALQWGKTAISEFQWRLRDAIDRSAANTLSDLNTTYRNNRFSRAAFFFEDIRSSVHFYSPETFKLAFQVLQEVAAKSGAAIPSDLQDPTPISTEPQFSNNIIANELQSLDCMSGVQFEQWCAVFLSKIGFHDISLTKTSGDQGVDLLAFKDGIKYAIQCKCYSSDIGNTPVQEVNAGKTIYNCHIGAVLTNRYFTPGGKEAASATGVLLWDREWIQQKLYLLES